MRSLREPSEVVAMERWYRRLLVVYPPSHRRVHGEEMLGVLLAAARDKRRPDLAEVVDLIGGALRIRVRSIARGYRDPGWRDALAVVGAVAPLLLFAEVLATNDILGVAIRAAGGHFEDPFWLVSWSVWPFTAGTAVLIVLVLLRLGSTAAIVALALTAAHLVIFPFPGSVGTAMWVLLGGLATMGLGLPPGPRRGLEILGWWRTALAGAGALALAALLWGDPSFMNVPNGLGRFMLVFVAAAGIGAACLLTPVGRRVVALLMIPAIPLFAGGLAAQGVGPEGVGPEGVGPVWLDGQEQRAVLLFGPPLLALCVIVMVARRGRHRPGAGRGGDGEEAP
jgi:hypothetical protein